MNFSFHGRIPPSKSILNRALVVSSYGHGPLAFAGMSQAQDVLHMELALQAFKKNESELWCGEAGTVLRFLALRVSRQKGRFVLRGSPQLFARPQSELKTLLAQLGVGCELKATHCVISGAGWEKSFEGAVQVDVSQSSQFASALVLNAFDLDFALPLQFVGTFVSRPYFEMSLSLAANVGLRFQKQDSGVVIAANSKFQAAPSNTRLLESDMSSAAATAALAMVAGEAHLSELFPEDSLQPDRRFVEIFRNMGAQIKLEDGNCLISQARELKPVDCSLAECPDLFPVLASLCALASGSSFLRAAPHLVHKESNRVTAMQELLAKAGRKLVIHGEDIEIIGQSASQRPASFEFDASLDHRLVMAAAVLQFAGMPVRIKGIESVKKSFPEFLKMASLGP